MIKILKGQKKHIDKEQGKTKLEAPRSVNYRATQNKNNIGTTALERSVVPEGLKAFHSTNKNQKWDPLRAMKISIGRKVGHTT